jgi:hypothetical protein
VKQARENMEKPHLFSEAVKICHDTNVFHRKDGMIQAEISWWWENCNIKKSWIWAWIYKPDILATWEVAA